LNNIEILKNSNRQDIVKLLSCNKGNIGVELGVAKGIFSSRMVDSGYFSSFIGIDMYGDTYHDVGEYKEALGRIGLFSNYKLLRMTFDEAYDLFEDESLDFIYIDGYAHNGEEGGQTIFNWSKKVKIGGVISGDDYHDDWPLVKEAVNEFVKSSGFILNLTSKIEDNPYCNYPSWGVVKNKSTHNLYSPRRLIEKSKKSKRPKKIVAKYLGLFLNKILNKRVISILKSIRLKLF
jgi:hypothetical protein